VLPAVAFFKLPAVPILPAPELAVIFGLCSFLLMAPSLPICYWSFFLIVPFTALAALADPLAIFIYLFIFALGDRSPFSAWFLEGTL